MLEAALELERAAEDALREAKSAPRSPASALCVARAAVVWRRCQLELAEVQVRVLIDNCKLARDQIDDCDDSEKAMEHECFITYHTLVLARTKCMRAQYVYLEALQHFLKLCGSCDIGIL